MSNASETQKLLDELAAASSGEMAKTIIINIQQAWINSHEDSSEKRLMSQTLSAIDDDNLVKAEREHTKLIKQNPDFVEAWHKRAPARVSTG